MVVLYALAFIRIDNQVLLLRRCNTSFGEGLYSLPGGEVKPDERALAAVKREVAEEVGLDIPEANFELVHTFNRKGTENPFIALVFKTNITHTQKPYNAEPEKHDDLKFFNIDTLPENIIPAHKQAIECIGKNIRYSEHGW